MTNKHPSIVFVTPLLATILLVQVAHGATCTIPSSRVSTNESLYTSRTCNQAFIDMVWAHFDFDKGDWDQGFGFHDPCNSIRPLSRTFNALWLLAYSAEDYATSTSDWSGNALRWGYPYSASKIDELNGRCGDGTAIARTWWGGWIFVDDRTNLYLSFFYNWSISARAGTIVHEARHAAGKGHNGGDDCPRGGSCDEKWTTYGANTYQVLYLWWYYVDGTRTTTALRNLAATRAQSIIDNGFVEKPPYVIN